MLTSQLGVPTNLKEKIIYQTYGNRGAFWSLESNYHLEQDFCHRIVPDLAVDLIFDLQANFFTLPFLSTTHKQLQIVNLGTDFKFFGIRLPVWYTYPLFAVKPGEIYNNLDGGLDVENKTLKSLQNFVADHLSLKPVFQTLQNPEFSSQFFSQIHTMLGFHFDNLSSSQLKILAYFNQISSFSKNPKDFKNNFLGSYSDRHQRRIFQDFSGFSQTDFVRICNFQAVRNSLETNPKSFYNYYYDQAYFSKEFKKFVGLSPLEYKKIYNMSAQYKTNLKNYYII